MHPCRAFIIQGIWALRFFHLFSFARLNFAIASAFRPCASTPARTASPMTGTWSTWAAGRRAARAWSCLRPRPSPLRAASRQTILASGRTSTFLGLLQHRGVRPFAGCARGNAACPCRAQGQHGFALQRRRPGCCPPDGGWQPVAPSAIAFAPTATPCPPRSIRPESTP